MFVFALCFVVNAQEQAAPAPEVAKQEAAPADTPQQNQKVVQGRAIILKEILDEKGKAKGWTLKGYRGAQLIAEDIYVTDDQKKDLVKLVDNILFNKQDAKKPEEKKKGK